MITAVATSPVAVDDTVMVSELVEQHESQLGSPKRMVGDHLYGSQDCLVYLQGRVIKRGYVSVKVATLMGASARMNLSTNVI